MNHFFLLATLLVLAACPSPTETQLTTKAEMPIAAGERIVLFPSGGDKRLVHCLGEQLAERGIGSERLLATQTFQDALFPWFEPVHAPRTVSELEAVLARPKVAETIVELRVRYLLSLAVRNKSDGFPGMLCGGGYGGAGCLGLAWSDESSTFDAVVWDVTRGSEAGTVTASSTGTSMGLGLILPIVFVAYTEDEVCAALAKGLSGALSATAEVGQ